MYLHVSVYFMISLTRPHCNNSCETSHPDNKNNDSSPSSRRLTSLLSLIKLTNKPSESSPVVIVIFFFGIQKNKQNHWVITIFLQCFRISFIQDLWTSPTITSTGPGLPYRAFIIEHRIVYTSNFWKLPEDTVPSSGAKHPGNLLIVHKLTSLR